MAVIEKHKTTKSVVFYIISAIWAFILIVPFLWMLISSFKTIDEVVSDPIVIFPETWRFYNYVELFQRVNFFRMMGNTLVIAVGGTACTVFGSVMVSYGFARFNCKIKNALFSILLGTMMLPWVVTTIPIYVVFAKLHWINTFIPFTLPNLGGNAVYTFMLIQFLRGIGREMDEAATIDGCSKLGILFKILVPLMLPSIMTIVIFSFVNGWSDIVGPSIYLRDFEMYTLSQGMYILSTPFNSRIQWHLCMTFGVLFTIPVFVIFFFSQKVYMAGLNVGGVKE